MFQNEYQDVYKQIQKLELPVEAVIDQTSIKTLSDTLDEATLGKQLFEIAAACRAKGIDPESALRCYTQKLVDSLEEAWIVP